MRARRAGTPGPSRRAHATPKGAGRVRIHTGEVFEIEAVAGVLNVFGVRAVSNGTRVGLIQRSPFCLIPSRKSLAAARLLLEVYHQAVSLGVVMPH